MAALATLSPEVQPFGEVPIPIEVRIGNRTATVQELASIRDGSVVLLDKPAGETLDLFVGDIRLATVEVVVVDDRLAVRITEFETCGAAMNDMPGEASA